MCITAGFAELENTRQGYLVDHVTKRHHIFYANYVRNLSDGPNCMILPIPGEVLELHDTTQFNEFLDESISSTNPIPKARGMTGGDKGIQFVEVGAYMCLIARGADVDEIKKALDRLPTNKRPEISADLLEWYLNFYGEKLNLVLCCFDSNELTEAQPMWVEFIPNHFEIAFFIGADAHDGGIPQIGENVDRDIEMVFACHGIENESMQKVYFSQKVPSLLDEAIWQHLGKINTLTTNCDWQMRLTNPLKNGWDQWEEVTSPRYGAFA